MTPLLDTLRASREFWEWFDYIALAFVFAGVVGESIGSLTNLLNRTAWKSKVEIVSALILILGLGGELFASPKLSEINGRIETILNKEAAEANERTVKLSIVVERESAKRLEAEERVRGLERAAYTAKAAQQRVETDLAKQQERAAVAERALLELQERIRPREFTTSQRARLVALLKVEPKGTFDIQYLSNNAESQKFANELLVVLKESGWTMRNIAGVSTSNPPVGLLIIVKDQNTPHPIALQRALEEIGFFANRQIVSKRVDDTMTLFVGVKP